MNYTSSLNAFLRGLEQGEFAGQMKGSVNSTPLYVGTETIQTALETARPRPLQRPGPCLFP